MLESLITSTEPVLPTNKMNELASLTYEEESFEIVFDAIESKLVEYAVLNSKKLKRTRNLLIVAAYLLKYGPGGFIDEFRSISHKFTCFRQFGGETSASDKEQAIESEIRSRAHYIVELLQDKEKILKEKSLAMLVKQKMHLLQEGRKNDENKSENY